MVRDKGYKTHIGLDT